MAALPRVGLLAIIFCAAASASGLGGGTFPDSRMYVHEHNEVRKDLHKPAGYPGPWSPLPPVEWSDEVATTAQAWAEHLRDALNCNPMHSDTRYGENLAAGKGLDAEDAVKLWAKEEDKYTYSPRYAFEPSNGHYTQLVWRETKYIGCGRATCGRRAIIVCRYSPAGNHIDHAPY